MIIKISKILITSALRLLACVRGWRTHCVRRRITLINYKGDNIPKYVCPTVIIDIARKITKFAYIKYVHPHADKVHPYADKAYPHADIRLSACGYRMRIQIITKLNPFNMYGILQVFMT